MKEEPVEIITQLERCWPSREEDEKGQKVVRFGRSLSGVQIWDKTERALRNFNNGHTRLVKNYDTGDWEFYLTHPHE